MDYKCICILLLQYNRNTNLTHIVRKSIVLIDILFKLTKRLLTSIMINRYYRKQKTIKY